MAIRRQWLDPDNEGHKESLRQAALKKFGPKQVKTQTLFPRCFATTLTGKQRTCDNSGKDGNEHAIQKDTETETNRNRNTNTNTFDYLLVMDLEGKDEIIEFPFLVIDVSASRECGRFQEYVRPKELFRGKPIEPLSPALPFPTALKKLDSFLRNDTPVYIGFNDDGLSGLSEKKSPRIAVLTCGDWDCRHIHAAVTCQLWNINTPELFTRWINIKRTFAEFYGLNPGRIRGMRSMLSRLQLLNNRGEPVHGFHHIGMYDVENIARCAFHLLDAGAQFEINVVTARGKKKEAKRK
eukprot:CAMPEP_0171302274 /NCGR_PEP_ID=MMETSP0816-20121228/11624_1 /TAXON_ID=420281 /ORGANISM="Proboscia inermis, Strain CCAP1064/1" /LENGTH=294 /DNA_ID=CAMNT_0011780581 /DNA_START=80 /DNA_END=967 /DNA_ORIENTATION=+